MIYPTGFLAAAGGYAFTNAEAATYDAAGSGTMDNTQKAAIDDFFSAMKAGPTSLTNILAKLAWLHLYCHPTAGDDLINLVDPGTYNGTVNGTVTHTPGSGRQGNGSTGSYIDTGWKIPLASQNSHTFGCWSLTTTQDAASAMGNGNSRILERNTSNIAGYQSVNATTRTVTSQMDGSGHYQVSRIDSSQMRFDRNNVNLVANGGDSSATPDATNNFWTCGRSGTPAYSTRMYAVAYGMKTALTLDERADVHTALTDLLTAFGAL